MTGYQLVKRCFATNDPDWTQFDAIERLAQLNRAIRIAHRILVNRRSHLAAAKATLKTTSGQDYVTLPDDFWMVVNPEKVAWIASSSQDIKLVPPEDLDVASMQQQGLPTSCYVQGFDSLYLGPIPDAEYELTFRYYTTPPELTLQDQDPDTTSGATSILQGNDTPYRGLLDDVLIPTVERLLLQREEYDVTDLIAEMQNAINDALGIADQNRHDRVSLGGDDWSWVGI